MTPRRWLGPLLALATLAACTSTAPDLAGSSPASAPSAEPVSSPTLQPDDRVDLTVYFRSGEGADAFLVPVTKEASIAGDLPSKGLALEALELLIAGPADQDGLDLLPPLPPATKVRSLRIEGDTAHVDLSHEVISRADEVGRAPENEVLALAAVAGTLTEFPAVVKVRLSVEGRQSGRHSGVDVGAFWGGWGLPEVLIRDDSVLAEPVEGEGVPDLELFGHGDQVLGSRDGEVTLTSVRVRDHTTYLRVIVEVADAQDPDAAPQAPPHTRAREVGGEVVLEIDDVVAYDADVAPGQRIGIDNEAFEGVTVEQLEDEGRVRIVVAPANGRAFWLHQLSSPTRIVLDVRK